MEYIGIDVGGTSIKYGVLNESGEFILTGTIPTRIEENKNYILEDIISLIAKIKKEYSTYNINGICVSTAGVVDAQKGEIIFSGPTIPGYTGTKIKSNIEKKFGILCEVENDVNCAGLGEYWKGAGKKSNSLVCLTLGTGIGGSIILNGKLFKGVGNTAGEIGYMEINNQHIQNIASVKKLVNSVNMKKNIKNKLTGFDIFDLAKKGDEICIKEIDHLLDNLSIALRNIIYLLNPEIIVIGGGITEQKEYLEPKIIDKINKGLISDTFKTTSIKLAEKGNYAGMLGALYNFLEKNKL